MARRRSRDPLNVYLNGRMVGKLQSATSGAIDFQYHADWLGWDHSFPVSLSLPLREDRYVGDPVIAVFDNLLPDSDRIRRRLAQKTRAGGADAYSLLAAIGRDCVGALQFLPEAIEPDAFATIMAEPVSEERIALMLKNLESAPLGVGDDEAFRISVAGMQEKTALLYLEDAWQIPHGTTATTHILKPQIGNRGGRDLSQSVENEHFCMHILGALGLPVAKTAIVDFEDQRALVIERFDRRWTSDKRLLRLPQEDCCQALSVPPSLKYESDGGPGMAAILELLKGSDTPQDDQAQFLKAQFAFWILAATDGHAKNFSVFLYPGGGFRLTPLYDVMSTQPLLGSGTLKRNQMRLAMSVGSNRHYRVHDIMPRHFEQTAANASISAELVLPLMSDLVERMPRALDEAFSAMPEDFPEQLRDEIIDGATARVRLFESAVDATDIHI